MLKLSIKDIRKWLGCFKRYISRHVYTIFILGSWLLCLIIVYSRFHHLPTVNTNYVPDNVNLDEAWLDLKRLTTQFHPYNSPANDRVRSWLLTRVDQILSSQNASYEIVHETAITAKHPAFSTSDIIVHDDLMTSTVFRPTNATSVYFESTNIIIHIKGTHSHQNRLFSYPLNAPGGVLVNAHYDSVSTGYGATDDGVGVVCILQILKYFSLPANRPYRDIILLLNNGEEDYLHGAYAFLHHPMARIPRVFVNLEGAGAGGKALLFRSTDAAVTHYYKNSPYPHGTVIANDGFSSGLIRSQTDFIVFRDELGLQGLDIAFYNQRSRYHTADDSTRFTSQRSVWHMLSAALYTVKGMAMDTTTTFGKLSVTDSYKPIHNVGVWWDFLEFGFIALTLRFLFTYSLVLAIIGPLLFGLFLTSLIALDKLYIFDDTEHGFSYYDQPPHSEADVDNDIDTSESGSPPLHVHKTHNINGWVGFFRPLIILAITVLAVYLSSLLLYAINPLIIYRSPYMVTIYLISAGLIVLSFGSQIAYHYRPTALARFYGLFWLCAVTWVILIVNATFEIDKQIASGYPVVFFFVSVFAAMKLSFGQFFRLPRKTEYVKVYPLIHWWNEKQTGTGGTTDSGKPTHTFSSRATTSVHQESHSTSAADYGLQNDEEVAEETTHLLNHGQSGYGTEAVMLFPTASDFDKEQCGKLFRIDRVQKNEQLWSGGLNPWSWIIEFLLIIPFNTITFAQIVLLFITALHQVPGDGVEPRPLYTLLLIGVLSLTVPLMPFSYRFSSQLTKILCFVLVTSALYNFFAFPFSTANKLHVSFLQQVDLDAGTNRVYLSGLEGYLQRIITELPSTAHRNVECKPISLKPGLVGSECSWVGLMPGQTISDAGSVGKVDIAHNDNSINLDTSQIVKDGVLKGTHYDLDDGVNKLDMTVTLHKLDNKKGNDTRVGMIYVNGGELSRACRIEFDSPILGFDVFQGENNWTLNGSRADFIAMLEEQSWFSEHDLNGTREIRLWSRSWNMGWYVWVNWESIPEGLNGRVFCEWNEWRPSTETKSSHVKNVEADNQVFLREPYDMDDDHEPRKTPKTGLYGIPALDEIMHYVPNWVAVRNRGDGLIEGFVHIYLK